MLFIVLAIYDYYKYTKDADAILLFDKGVNSIKKNNYLNTTIMAIRTMFYWEILLASIIKSM